MLFSKMKKIYDANLMGYINLFETMSRVKVKDAYIREGTIVFIIEENGLRKALGRNGSNIKRLVEMIKKKIKLIEFSSNVEQFIRNFIYPSEAEEIKNEDGIIKIKASGSKTKGLLIGRESKNLKEMKNIVGRYFSVKDIIIV